MEGQRQRIGRGRRRRKRGREESRVQAEPILIAARRPNSPLLEKRRARKAIAASARPVGRVEASLGCTTAESGSRAQEGEPSSETQPRRMARIVEFRAKENGEQEVQRQRLLDRLLMSQGRGAISRAADEFLSAGFEFPQEQEVQLQLLEHFDEDRARSAIENLGQLLVRQSPIKRPVLEQRLRRLEEYADEMRTREAAASLRRVVRA